MVKLPIFMDNNSTTRIDPRVLEEMMPFLTEAFGNAASRSHVFGWRAEEAVDKARGQVAALIGASSKEIVFTSGATESNNLAIKGVAHQYASRGKHIITQTTEHKAVLDSCKALEREGFTVTYLAVDKTGRVDVDKLREAITDETTLVSIMWANNEIGTIQPIREIGKLCHEKGVIFHCDAVQAAGKLPINVDEDCIDLMSISGHKVYGPKGVGALYVRRRRPRVRLLAEMDGGGHERGMRSGTLNVPGIVGLGAALELAGKEMEKDTKHSLMLRERLHAAVNARLKDTYLNGNPVHRLAGNLNISFAYVEGESLLMALKDIAVSSGSACTSASLEPSYVLHAIGVGDDLAHTSIRFGIGRFNTVEEIDYVAQLVCEKVEGLRALSPLWEMVQEGIDLTTIQWAAH